MTAIGKPLTRKSGLEKVTGAAKYGVDHHFPDLAYAVIVPATIASGRIEKIDTSRAESVPGVHFIMTHLNTENLFIPETFNGPFQPMGSGGQQNHMPLRDDRIVHDGQYIAVVVGETFEAAQEGALLVEVDYLKSEAVTFDHGKGDTKRVEALYYGLGEGHHHRGDPHGAMEASPVRVELDLHTPSMHHNPIELHGTVAFWQDDQLIIHESNAWPHGLQYGLAEMLGIGRERIRTISPYCGGSFGAKALAMPHTALCALAAKRLGRPVRLQLSRAQMFYCVGQRAATQTQIEVGAERDGKLNSLVINGTGDTPMFQDWACEPTTLAARHMYSNPHMETIQRVKRTHNGPTTPMRGPGETAGMFVMESAMNALADRTGIDPVEVRRRNHAERNYENDLPWSSKSLLECYDRGEELFGWKDRPVEPRSMMRDGNLIGWGMASATYPMLRSEGHAKVSINRTGHVTIGAASHEIGTGTYTVMSQIAAEVLDINISKVRMNLGDTDLPANIGGVGAMTAASLGPAVQAASQGLIRKLARVATEDRNSPLYRKNQASAAGRDGGIEIDGLHVSYADILQSAGRFELEQRGSSAPGSEFGQYAMYSFGANFVEVEVDPITMWAKVSRVVGTYASGRILNPKTSRSQIIGGIVFAIGSAMTEHSLRDKRNGRWVSDDFGIYHVPVQADVPPITVEFIPEEDKYVNPLGAKGLGELGGVGMNAAITHALYHATGVTMLDHLPYTPEALLKESFA